MWIEGRALYRESRAAAPRSVTVSLDLRGLTIRSLAGDDIAHWPFATLVRHGGDPLAIGRRKTDPQPDARVEIGDPAIKAAFEAALKAIPRAEEGAVPRAFVWASALVLASLAIAVAAVLWVVSVVTERLAPMVPSEVAEILDAQARETVLGGLDTAEGLRCTGVDGGIAIGRLADRLAIAGAARPMTLDVSVYRSDVANAVALPGGTVIVTSALIRRVRTPDAFAGVLAHEIAHVHFRHGLARVLHEGGLMVALALITGDGGGATAAVARRLVGAAYSRDAEREADAFAVTAVAAAGGDPKALGPFLIGLEGRNGPPSGPLKLLSTHPLSTERLAAIEAAAADETLGDGPLVTDADWAAILQVCG